MAGTLKEKIYSTILEQIMLGEITVDAFLTEARLSEQFEASRAPVREALVALCNEGVLQNIPRVGYRLVSIGVKEVREALSVRLLLESEAARQALRNMDPEKDRIVDQLIRDEEEGDHRGLSLIEWMKNGEEVHLALARFSGNSILEELIIEMIRKLRRASTQVYVENSRSGLKSSPYHLRILQALKRRDEEELLSNLAHDIALTNNLLGASRHIIGSEI